MKKTIAILLLLAAPAAYGAQCAYPTGDEDNTTYYWSTPGASSTHYTLIDNDTTCNNTAGADYILEDSGLWYHSTLSSLTDPESSSSHSWSCTAARTSNKANTLTIDLYQGSTQINTTTTCSGEVTNGSPSEFPSGKCTLTATEADSITDYTDLRLRLYATGTNPTDVYVYSCMLSVPDAPGGARRRVIINGG